MFFYTCCSIHISVIKHHIFAEQKTIIIPQWLFIECSYLFQTTLLLIADLTYQNTSFHLWSSEAELPFAEGERGHRQVSTPSLLFSYLYLNMRIKGKRQSEIWRNETSQCIKKRLRLVMHPSSTRMSKSVQNSNRVWHRLHTPWSNMKKRNVFSTHFFTPATAHVVMSSDSQ